MKSGVSTLNPYAASYVPLSKREATEKIEVPAKISYCGNQTVWSGPDERALQNKQRERTSDHDVSVLQSHSSHGFYGSSSQNPDELREKLPMIEEFDILEYLKTSFPGVSEESLNHVYMANKCDLEATVDMLNQLEFDTFEPAENLPDTLDIGDIPELGSLAESSSVQLKNVVGEASASSSGSPVSESPIIT